ncbi:DUF3667 domain-containing protein [Chryseobacterium tongliaoense]|uniref:DUF3667 domain-containing protein n=1 Tax=Chryseobacterium tongliaoense TaxID=3240933 RepID=UPI00351607AE
MIENNRIAERKGSQNREAKESENLKKIDGKYILNEIRHVLHFEEGFLFTLKEMTLRPGNSVKEYIEVNRKKYVKPLIYLIFSSVFFVLTANFLEIPFSFFGIDYVYQLTGRNFERLLNKHLGYAILFSGFFYALWVWVMFRKSKYNIYEIFILMSFLFGNWIFISTFCLIFIYLITYISIPFALILIKLSFYAQLIYVAWGVAQFFGKQNWIIYGKAFCAPVLGVLSFLIFWTLTGFLLDKLF